MSVLVDSNIWSEVLRKPNEAISEFAIVLKNLILEHQVQLIGAIRQEVLSGVRDASKFSQFKNTLSGFTDRLPSTTEYEQAAAMFNLFRSNGIQASATDCLICACSLAWNQPILTKDNDFLLYQKHIPLRLYSLEPII